MSVSFTSNLLASPTMDVKCIGRMSSNVLKSLRKSELSKSLKLSFSKMHFIRVNAWNCSFQFKICLAHFMTVFLLFAFTASRKLISFQFNCFNKLFRFCRLQYFVFAWTTMKISYISMLFLFAYGVFNWYQVSLLQQFCSHKIATYCINKFRNCCQRASSATVHFHVTL